MRLAVVLRLSPFVRARASRGSAFCRFVVVFVFVRVRRELAQLPSRIAEHEKKRAIFRGEVRKNSCAVSEVAGIAGIKQTFW